MARKIIWSKNARISPQKILEYWIKRNKYNEYAKKLNLLFKKSVKQIEDFPYSRIKIENEIYIGKLIKEYYLFYTIKFETIEILLILGHKTKS